MYACMHVCVVGKCRYDDVMCLDMGLQCLQAAPVSDRFHILRTQPRKVIIAKGHASCHWS